VIIFERFIWQFLSELEILFGNIYYETCLLAFEKIYIMNFIYVDYQGKLKKKEEKKAQKLLKLKLKNKDDGIESSNELKIRACILEPLPQVDT
jgi:hypothetical protein